jgi:hypothetical protein
MGYQRAYSEAPTVRLAHMRKFRMHERPVKGLSARRPRQRRVHCR